MRNLLAAAAVLLFCASAHAADKKFFMELPANCTAVAAPAIPEGYRTGIAELGTHPRPGDLDAGLAMLALWVSGGTYMAELSLADDTATIPEHPGKGSHLLQWYMAQLDEAGLSTFERKTSYVGAYDRLYLAPGAYINQMAHVLKACNVTDIKVWDTNIDYILNISWDYQKAGMQIKRDLGQDMETMVLTRLTETLGGDVVSRDQREARMAQLPAAEPKREMKYDAPVGKALLAVADMLLAAYPKATPEAQADIRLVWAVALQLHQDEVTHRGATDVAKVFFNLQAYVLTNYGTL